MKKLTLFLILTAFISFEGFGQQNADYTAFSESFASQTGLEFSVYPNPSTRDDIVLVKFSFTKSDFPEATLILSNVLGQQILVHKLNDTDFLNGNVPLDLSEHELKKGLYFIKIRSGENSNLQKLVVN